MMEMKLHILIFVDYIFVTFIFHQVYGKNDDSSSTSTSSSSSPVVLIILTIIFFIVMLASLGLMIYCIRKYCIKRKEAKSKSSKVALPSMGAAVAQNLQQQKAAAAAGNSQPKQIKITGTRQVTPLVVKLNGLAANSSTPAATKSPKSASESTSAPKTTKPSTFLKKTKKEAVPSEHDIKLDPTQPSSNNLEPIFENEELNLKPGGKKITKTFVCFAAAGGNNNNEWREPCTAETDDFSFEIESGNTFSLISNN